jgi:iron complex outermembrane recepter protein
LDIVLETQEGTALAVDAIPFNAEGNALMAEIPNAALALPDGKPFQAVNPTADIAQITIEQQTPTSLLIRVVGQDAPPTTKVSLKTGAPVASTPPESKDEDEEELVVTGAQEQEGYRVPNSSTATKTDTPLRDIPGSVQIVPRQLIEDRQLTRIQQIVDNVPGLRPDLDTSSNTATSGASFIIRGFSSTTTNFRDGFRESSTLSPVDVAGVEQVEVLKGPASVLYGQNQPGGIVNTVSKKPLTTPQYIVDFTAGSFNFYRPTLDITGPLNADKTAAYRLNIAYENAGSFRDFVDSESIFVAPALAFQLGKNTTLNLNVEYQRYRYTPDTIPLFVIKPKLFDIPISRFLGEPDINTGLINSWRARAILEHRFSENWKLRSAFSTTLNTLIRTDATSFTLLDDRRTLERTVERFDQSTENYTLQNELVGKFKTGSIAHQMLFGVELSRERFSFSLQSAPIAPIDIFNPVYGAQPGPFIATSIPGSEIKTDALGIYVQDQITITDQLKLLVGGRFDLAKSSSPASRAGENNVEVTDSAFSPRAGIVYQPIKPVSLYFSYATSFVPQAGESATGQIFDPERGRQFELGVKADLIPDRLSATLAGYEITKKNVLVTDPNDENFLIQTGAQKSRGLEFSLVGEPVKGWKTSLSYAYTDAFVSQDTFIPAGDTLAGVPAHQFGFWNSYEFPSGALKGFGMGLGLYYSSRAEAALPNTLALPSYFRADASVFYKRDNWELQLSVNNFTNTQYYLGPGIVPQAPLTVLGSFSVKF